MFFILLTFFVDFYYGLKIRFLQKKLCISSLDHQNPLLSNCNNIMIYSMRKLTWHSCINYMDQCITNSYTSAIVYEYWPQLWNKLNKIDRDQCITKQLLHFYSKIQEHHLQFATCYFVRSFDKFRSFSKTNQVVCAYMNKWNHAKIRFVNCIVCFSHVFCIYLIRVGTMLHCWTSKNEKMQSSGSPNGRHSRLGRLILPPLPCYKLTRVWSMFPYNTYVSNRHEFNIQCYI